MLVGTADPENYADGAPTLASLDHEAVRLGDVLVFQLMCEIEAEHACAMLPPSLHPTSPPIVNFGAWRVNESPWGEFALAWARLECRSGLRPRGLWLRGVIDNEEAAAELASGWGFRLELGEVDFDQGYDGTSIAAETSEGEILSIGLSNPEPLGMTDVQYVSGVHPAHTAKGYRLVQVDVDHELERAERGRAVVDVFEAAAFGEERIEPTYPISASIGRGNVLLRQLRFICKPDVLAFMGTERAAG
jgi:hypothetical protein